MCVNVRKYVCIYCVCMHVLCVFGVFPDCLMWDSLKLWQRVSELKQFIEPCIQLLPVGFDHMAHYTDWHGALDYILTREEYTSWRMGKEDNLQLCTCNVYLNFPFVVYTVTTKRIDIMICRGFPENNPNNLHITASNHFITLKVWLEQLSVWYCFTALS